MRKKPKESTRPGRKRKGDLTAAERAEAAMIRGFREAKHWTHEQLARRLGLDGATAIYAWERAAYGPAPGTYIKLANLAVGVEWKYTERFLSKAGVDLLTLEQIADKLPKGRELPTDSNVEIYSLREPREAALSFPRSLVANEASTRFVRLRESFSERIRQGDIFLIDTSETDLRNLGKGSFVAISCGRDTDPDFGFLSEQDATVGEIPVFYLMLTRPDGGDFFLGTSTGSRPPDLIRENLVLGRVVAWIISARKSHAEKRKK